MKQKIKILELRCVYGSGGGPEKTIFLTAKKIKSKRFHTEIAYIRAKNDMQFNLMKKQYFDLSVSFHEIIEKWRFDFGLINKIVQICRENSIDIIHSHEYKTDVLCWFVKKKVPVKWIAMYHLDYADSLKLLFYRWLDYKVLSSADKVICVSEALKKLLEVKKVNPKKLDVLLNGIDSDYFKKIPESKILREKFQISKNEIIIGAIGRFSIQKNYPLLLKAFQKVLENVSDIHLILVGEGPKREDLIRLSKKLNLENRVHFMGFIEDVRLIYNELDLFVLSSDQEGLPNTVLEAMAMGVPVIATDVGGVSELITDEVEGLIIQKGSLNELVESMLKLLKNQGLRNIMAKQARQRIEKYFSFTKRVKKLERIYEKLCKE